MHLHVLIMDTDMDTGIIIMVIMEDIIGAITLDIITPELTIITRVVTITVVTIIPPIQDIITVRVITIQNLV